MKETFEAWDPAPATWPIIDMAEAICDEYAAQGFRITLRQLYYQFVARDLLPNTQRSYDRLGSIVAKARMAGFIDWEHIEDRTRNVRSVATWDDPAQILRASARQFRRDRWADQDHRIEVWIEKDALAGVIAPTCEGLEVPYFSCRGYTSLSEMYAAHQRCIEYLDAGQVPIILHLGDHDPSGIDMTRDIRDRLRIMTGEWIDVDRLALNRDQVDEYDPPPNPAKVTDSRAGTYIAEHGPVSWELDALDPATLAQLITDAVYSLRDADRWAAAVDRDQADINRLTEIAASWNEEAS